MPKTRVMPLIMPRMKNSSSDAMRWSPQHNWKLQRLVTFRSAKSCFNNDDLTIFNHICFRLIADGGARWLAGLAWRTLSLRIPSGMRGRTQALQRMGDAQHQQPQRQHPQEVLSRRPRLQQNLRPRQRRQSVSQTCHMWQGQEETAR